MLALLVGMTWNVNAQWAACNDFPPNPICATCMEIEEVENPMLCVIEFYWDYNGSSCKTTVGAGTIPANTPPSTVTPAFPWKGFCAKFCDDPCECPSAIKIKDPDSGNVIGPWGPPSTTCCWTNTYHNVGTCNGTSYHVDIELLPNGRLKYRFYH